MQHRCAPPQGGCAGARVLSGAPLGHRAYAAGRKTRHRTATHGVVQRCPTPRVGCVGVCVQLQQALCQLVMPRTHGRLQRRPSLHCRHAAGRPWKRATDSISKILPCTAGPILAGQHKGALCLSSTAAASSPALQLHHQSPVGWTAVAFCSVPRAWPQPAVCKQLRCSAVQPCSVDTQLWLKELHFWQAAGDLSPQPVQ